MSLLECFQSHKVILMEGALGQRLKTEFGLTPDDQVALAGMLYQPGGREALESLWREYMAIARRYRLPLLVTTPTRRANRERATRFGRADTIIGDHVALLRRLQAQEGGEVYVGGLMGCRGDAYTGEGSLSRAEAADFHRWQAERFRAAQADFLMAGIMPTLPEALGMAQAMGETGLPYLISFTVQADGCLIDGTPISTAVAAIDGGMECPPLGYMANCVHPAILRQALEQPCNRTELVRRRFLGLQANTSARSYAELEQGVGLAPSGPEKLAREMVRLEREQGLRLFGGCCGTDGRYLAAMARALVR